MCAKWKRATANTGASTKDVCKVKTGDADTSANTRDVRKGKTGDANTGASTRDVCNVKTGDANTGASTKDVRKVKTGDADTSASTRDVCNVKTGDADTSAGTRNARLVKRSDADTSASTRDVRQVETIDAKTSAQDVCRLTVGGLCTTREFAVCWANLLVAASWTVKQQRALVRQNSAESTQRYRQSSHVGPLSWAGCQMTPAQCTRYPTRIFCALVWAYWDVTTLHLLKGRGLWIFSAALCRAPVDNGLSKAKGSPCINPFTPKSDHLQNSPAASAEILHHTVWRTWLFIADSDERWLYYQFSLPHLHINFKRFGRMYFLNLGVKGLTDTYCRAGNEAFHSKSSYQLTETGYQKRKSKCMTFSVDLGPPDIKEIMKPMGPRF